MSNPQSALRRARRPCLALVLSLASTLCSAEAPLLSALYARYLASGHSDVEIHLSAAGRLASARLRPLADGSWACSVSGLNVPGAAAERSAAQLQLAALLVHEVTHCLVAPHTAALGGAPDGPAAQASERGLRLAAESISDARAVIEVFRHDGAEAAQSLVALMLPQRLRAAGSGHATAAALQAALAHMQQQGATPPTATQAFAAALQIGLDSAWAGLGQTLANEGQAALMHSAEVQQAKLALQAALARALQAFEQGRFGNNAFTLRQAADASSSADRHVFIDTDGRWHSVPTLSAEGAHSAARLRAMVDASDAPEHRLAVQWLLHEGRLDVHTLPRARQIMARFIQAVGAGSAQRLARAEQLLGEAITRCQRGADLSALLDDAASRLQAAVSL
jgi:hypothetical protein